METRINENGEIEVVDKFTAQEYISNKMEEIESLTMNLNDIKSQIDTKVNELKALVSQ